MIQTGKNRSNVKETCRSSTLSTTNPEWTFLFMSLKDTVRVVIPSLLT